MRKYTVVIPTRNNIDTLPFTLQTCLAQDYPLFKIVICDNGTDHKTEEYIRRFNDERVEYYRTGVPLSMTENFEFALSKVKEGFIIFIGADDGLMPGAINYVDGIIEKFQVKAVACQYAQYFWPNAPVAVKGRLRINPLNYYSSGVEIRNSEHWIKKTLAFETELYVCDLPGLYYGVIHRDIVDMAMPDGKYFRSIAPDGYSAFATAIHIENYAYSFRPFCIAGLSGKSNGLAHATNGDIAKQFVIENKFPVHKYFVYCSAMEVITGESFYQVKKAFPDKCQKYSIDFRLLLRRILENKNAISSAPIYNAVQKMAEIHKIDPGNLKVGANSRLKVFLKRSVRYFKFMVQKGTRFLGVENSEQYGVRNIYDASIVLSLIEKINNGGNFETGATLFRDRVKNRLMGRSSRGYNG
ncbi:MAG: glycosyltransferase family A protein [Ferruginibacter sp.]